ncbi:MAG: hypothetical protein ACYCXG_02685 [Acidiferrobacter sp.]
MSHSATLALLGLVLSLSIIPVAAAEDALILTVGAFHLSHNQQDLGGTTTRVATNAGSDYSIAWELRHYNGIAYGAEYLIFRNDLNQVGRTGTATSQLFMLTLKKYDRPVAHVYPYIGVSAGLADTALGGIGGRTGIGPAVEVDGGVEFEWAHTIGLYTELRGVYAQPGDIYGTRVNVSGVGLYGGISLLF